MKRFRIFAACLFCAVLSMISLGCPYDGTRYPTTYGQPTSTPTPVPLTASVTILSSTFSPAAVTILNGGTVVWVNQDPYNHSIYPDISAGVCGTDNPIIASTSVTLTFSTARTYYYHCSVHVPSCTTCSFSCTGPMTGTVVVQ